MVIDSNRLAHDRDNPTCTFLRRAMDKPEFKLLAIVITHLHFDHYSGVPEILELTRRWRPAHDRLFLPLEHDLFRGTIEACATTPGRGYLRLLGDFLAEATTMPPELLPLQFVHHQPPSVPENGDSGALGPWVFALHPRHKDYLKKYLEDELDKRWVKRQSGESDGELCRQESWFTRNRNRFSSVLGTGCGCDKSSPHFLFTSDVTGDVFGEMTAGLKRILGQVNFSSLQLARISLTESAGRRIVPLRGSTIPHHGSPHMPLQYTDLEWWLCGPPERPFAVVQGDRFAFGWETLEVLEQADMRIWTSAEPKRLTTGAKTARRARVEELERRVPIPPRESPEAGSIFTLREVDADPSVNAEAPVPHLALYGDRDGIHCGVARDFYEVRFDTSEVLLHHLSRIPLGRLPATTGTM